MNRVLKLSFMDRLIPNPSNADYPKMATVTAARDQVVGTLPVSTRLVSHDIWRVILFFLLYIAGYCYGVVSYKASHALRPFCDLLCVLI
jgi:hypothetical protein